MKRLSSSDSLGGLMPICPNSTDEHNQGNNPIYMTMMEGLDEEGCVEESGQAAEKKRRLSVDQVKALEKNFEVENKLEPERKVKLAQELGLQPRQVAVWFQNRRARWKTKQLEKDFGLLKANYDGLKLNYEKLQHDKESLLKEIGELRSKLNEDGNGETKPSVKEESKLETPLNCMAKCEEGFTEPNLEDFNGSIFGGASIFGDLRDGSSDSDSSAIFNEDNNNSSPTAAISSSGVVLHHSPRQFLDIQNASTSSMNASFHFSDTGGAFLGDAHRAYQPQFVKIEEHNFFGEESCSSLIFSDDQAPTLQWYGSDELN